MLRVAEGFALPSQAVTETFGILAVRGAGKSTRPGPRRRITYVLATPHSKIFCAHTHEGARQRPWSAVI